MTDSTVNVTFKAVGDFRSLIRSTADAAAAQRALRSEVEKTNRSLAAQGAASAAARRNETAAVQDGTAALKARTRAQSEFEKGAARAAAAIKRQTAALRDGERAAGAATRRVGADTESAGKKAELFGQKFEAAIKKMLGIKSSESTITGSLGRIRSGLDKLRNARFDWRPSFVMLIPAIAGVLSLLNPLIAGFGGVVAAAIGMASSLGTLAGAAVGLVPALTAALGVAVALKVALSGVGAAISAGTKAASASGGSSSATKQDPYSISSVEKISRAQDAYRRSVQDVHFAEQNLFDARRQYTRQVQDLTEAVNEYTDATKAADAASVASAEQNYQNVLASSASTAADKATALAAIAQAKDQQQRDALQHERDVQDLAELKQGGRENNQSVVDARRGVTDATNARRDAALGVKNAKYDAAHPVAAGTAGGAAAADPYAAALGQLSPAAKTFVQWVVSMRSAWVDLQRAVQQAFFSKFIGDLDRLKGLLPPLTSMLSSIAGALGGIVNDLIKQVSGPSWRSDLVTFGQLVAPILTTAGKGLQSLLDAFKNITIAGLPFLSKIVGALSTAAIQFGKFVDAGRKSGSIKKYLDDVWSVMKKWATVVSNIAGTLLNYGKAAAPFGQWLTDGIVKLTGAWLQASKDATKANSPFKNWLDDVKPLLHEMSLDLGAFFGWIGKTASNKDNISAITDLLKAFRTRVAPKIADILQQLVTARVPEAVTNFVVALTAFLDDLVKNGGAKGIANFFNGLAWILNALTAAASSPVGRFITNALLPLIGTLAAFALPVGPVSLLLKLLNVLTDFSPKGALSKVGGWLGDIASAVGRFVGPAFAGAATVIGDVLGVLAAPIVLPKIDLPGNPKNAPQASGPLDTKTWIKNASLALTTFATGVPGLVARFTGDAFRTTGGPAKWIKTQTKKISDFAGSIYKRIASAAGDVFRTVQTVASWLGTQAKKIWDWASRIWRSIATSAGDVFRSVTSVGGWLGKQGTAIGRWAGGIPRMLGRALSGIWSAIPTLGAWLNQQIKNLGPVGGAVASALGLGGGGGSKSKGSGFGSGGGGSFGGAPGGKWATTIGQALRMAGAPASWAGDIATIIQHESSGNPTAKNMTDINARNGIPSTGLMQLIPPNFNTYAGSLRSRGITDPLANIYAGIKYIQSRYGNPDRTPGIEALAAGRAYSYYARGGLVPGKGNKDTVRAMLTPGEFVVPKPVVQQLGLANLEAMRAMSSMPMQHRVRSLSSGTQMTQQAPFIAGDLIVNNPKTEETGDSLARSVRRVAYLHRGVR